MTGSCEPWQEALSALADGEAPGVDPALLDAHVRGCVDCRAFAAQQAATGRRTRVGAAPVMPDLSDSVVRRVAAADRASRWIGIRGLLAIVAVQIVVLALPQLVLGEADATDTHAARHLGAFSVAYGVGLLVVVVRPARARTMLPVVSVLALTLFITAVVDVASGDVPLSGEVVHVPELLSVPLVWLSAVPIPTRRR